MRSIDFRSARGAFPLHPPRIHGRMQMLQYWTLADIARELGITRERARQIWDKGRGWKHDAEDRAGRPLFRECPVMPEQDPRGRPRVGEPALKDPQRTHQRKQ